MKKIKIKPFYIYLLLLNIILIFLRISIGYEWIQRYNFVSTILFFFIFFHLLYLFFRRNYDYFILLWLSFYFASPLITLPFTQIGSLGILNGIFIPLMLISSFNFRKKYFWMILLLLVISSLNIISVPSRIILSSLFHFVAPLVFTYFVMQKCKNLNLIIFGSIFIALINVPLSIYQLIARPAWGIISDWRIIRITGNLFHPNNLSMYLLPNILILYAFLRNKFNKWYFIAFLILLIINILTFSRIGLLSLVIGLVLFEGIYKSGKRFTLKKVVIPLILILLILLFISIGPEESHLATTAINERTGIWNSILPLIKENLFLGKGLGSYEVYRYEVINQLSPHNAYLNIIFELGLIGLAVIMLFIFNLMIDLSKGIKTKEQNYLKPFGVALIIGILIFSLTDGAAFSQVISLNSWILIGVCMSYHKKTRGKLK